MYSYFKQKKGLKTSTSSTSPTHESNNATTSDMINENQISNANDNSSEQNTTIAANTSNPRNPPQYAKLHNLRESKLIEFILRKHPRENAVPRLYRECIKVSDEITIRHLKRFLGKKLDHTPWTDFQITINAGGRQVIMDDSIQLKQVRGEICDYFEGMMLMLQYFVQPFASMEVPLCVPVHAPTTDNNSAVEKNDICETSKDGNGHNGIASPTETT